MHNNKLKLNRLISSEDLDIFKFVLLTFLGWRLALILITFFGLSFIPFYETPGNLEWSNSSTEYWARWANWDGGHFRSIAEFGYKENQVVFFPLYPILIKTFSFFGFNFLWSGLLVSNMCGILALYFLYKLVLLDYSREIAQKVIFLLLAFPTAFYLAAVYSESLFLLLVTSSFYFARKKRWLISLSLAGLASATRLAGIFVILAIAVEYYFQTSTSLSFKALWRSSLIRYIILISLVSLVGENIKYIFSGTTLYVYLASWDIISKILLSIIAILIFIYIGKLCFRNIEYKKILTIQTSCFLISLLPLLSYFTFLFLTQGNFLAFIKHESSWGRHIDFPWSAPRFYAEQLFNRGVFTPGQTGHLLLEFSFFVFFLIFFFISYRKLRLSYTLFFAGAFLLPLASGTLISIHRYGLVIFPIFILMALIKNQIILNYWVYFSLMLQGLLVVLFFNSFWVS